MLSFLSLSNSCDCAIVATIPSFVTLSSAVTLESVVTVTSDETIMKVVILTLCYDHHISYDSDR